jgi:hypothetical protein
MVRKVAWALFHFDISRWSADLSTEVWKISGKTIIILERRGYDRLFLIGAV